MKKYGDAEIKCVDTCGWKSRPFKLYKEITGLFQECDRIIMLPGNNGLKIFSFLLLRLAKKYNVKIYYDVIGGWLPSYVEKKKALKKRLRQFNGIWVETAIMKKRLTDLGFENITLLPNFKDLTPLKEDELVYFENPPFKFCTFSRVMELKGITDAITAIAEINKNGIAALLDIYGPIEESYKEQFDNLINKYGGFISYKGVSNSENTVEVLKDYYFMLFPTRASYEGIPGSIIDALASGIPVIASKWDSVYDIVDDSCGIIYGLCDLNGLINAIKTAIADTEPQKKMKINAVRKAKDFTVEKNIEKVLQLLG